MSEAERLLDVLIIHNNEQTRILASDDNAAWDMAELILRWLLVAT